MGCPQPLVRVSERTARHAALVGGTQTVGAFKAWARAHVGAHQFPALNRIWTHESGWRYGSPARAWHFWNTHHWY